MGSVKKTESGVKSRTRRAILEAARQMLPDNPSASIVEIADSAGVGRSTVHRYFRDRNELIDELALHVYRLSNEAVARAKPEAGPPAAALRRIIEEQFDLGPALDFIYNEQTHKKKPGLFAEVNSADQQVTAAIQVASKSNQTLPFQWRERVFWTLLRLGSEVAQEGQARHEVIDAIMTTLVSGFLQSDVDR
jgi:TetR/AcrR family transcriptional repressor of lfrA